MTTYGPGMDLVDPDPRDSDEDRDGVSAEQHRVIREWDETEATKVLVLDALEFLASDECTGRLRPIAASALECAGLAPDASGIWRDAMVRAPDGRSWVYEPSSVNQ